MKTMLALLILAFSANADAAKDVSIPNADGGEITFSFLKGSCGENKFLAYATSKGGQITVRGCWFYDSENERAFIVWQDGTVYEYK